MPAKGNPSRVRRLCRFIEAHRSEHPVKVMYRLLDVALTWVRNVWPIDLLSLW